MKRIHLLLATALTLALGLLASPAQAASTSAQTESAAPPTELVTTVPMAFKSEIGFMWEYVDLGFGPILICPQCGTLLEVKNIRERLNPEAEKKFHADVLNGMRNLGLARTTDKPDLAPSYRASALNNFTNAAEAVMGGVVIHFTPVGYYDLKNGKAIPAKNESLNALAQSLTDGISLLQKSLAGGSPELRDQAAAKFDSAIKHLHDAAERSGGIVIHY